MFTSDRPRPGRQGLWQADLITLLLLAAFVVAAFILDAVLAPVVEWTGFPLVGLALASIPAVIWMYFFYRRDRVEPEPRHLVLSVFVLAGLLAAAVGEPVIRDLFKADGWIDGGLVVRLLGGLLVVGMTQELLKYLAIRFSVYETVEFNERTDGIIYGTAAGLGYATVLNTMYIVESGGVDLGVASIHVALTALAQAGFGGIVGHFLSQQKLEHRPVWWSAAGVAIAAATNSVFHAARTVVVSGDLAIGGVLLGPWIGLILAAAFSVGLTLLLIRLIQRDERRMAPAEELP